MSENSRELAALCALLEKDALAAAKQCKSTFQKSTETHNEQLYALIAFLCAQTRKLASCEQDHADFFEQDFWQRKPKSIAGKRTVRLAVRYMLGARQSRGALYEQARSYAEIVMFLNEQNTPPLSIPAILRKETLYHLLDKHEAKTTSECISEQTHSRREGGKRSTEVSGGGSRVAAKNPAQAPPIAEDVVKNSSQHEALDVRRSVHDLRMSFNPNNDIFFDGAQYQNAILSLPVGRVFKVRCRRLPDIEGVQKFKILHYKYTLGR